jgi:arylsulfatase A
MKKQLFVIIIFIGALSLSWESDSNSAQPNIILIMADDMGYECLGANGSISYQTPNIDDLASKGIRFSTCISQPLCTPSRVKIMTGLYNYRNYDYFGHLECVLEFKHFALK